MNEETIISKSTNAAAAQQVENQKGNAWKHVTLGGVSGILMGVGLMYASSVYANNATPDASPEDAEANGTLPMADVSDEQSFGDAFAEARAEVGPGGVFRWHGGIYNTYTADEWNAMTAEQRADFARQVSPEIQPEAVSTPTDAHPNASPLSSETAPEQPAEHHAAEDVTVVDEHAQQVAEQIESNFTVGDDVHIVGYTDIDGHLTWATTSTATGKPTWPSSTWTTT